MRNPIYLITGKTTKENYEKANKKARRTLWEMLWRGSHDTQPPMATDGEIKRRLKDILGL